MGQCHWSIVCAFVPAFATATTLAAPPANNPFGDDPPRVASAAEGKVTQNAADRETPKQSSSTAPFESQQAKERIQKVLAGPLREPLDFTAQPLSDVVTILEETYAIPIEFDTAALDAVAASPDVEVTLQINNISLRSALDLMLKNGGAKELTYIIDKDVLLITTEEEAQSRLEVKVYRVDDLIDDASFAAPGAADAGTLIDVIVASVEHESWQDNETGEGEIHAFPPGMIVISQTHRVHEQVERLLDDLRRGKAEVQQAGSAEREAAAQRPMTRAIRLYDIGLAEPQNRQVIHQAIQQSVDWESRGDDLAEDDVFLHVLADRVLVRHLPAVVRQVEVAVREIAPPTSGGFGGNQSGGGMF